MHKPNKTTLDRAVRRKRPRPRCRTRWRPTMTRGRLPARAAALSRLRLPRYSLASLPLRLLTAKLTYTVWCTSSVATALAVNSKGHPRL